MQFDTKIAVVLRDDLAVWQKTNVTAFLVSAPRASTTRAGTGGPAWYVRYASRPSTKKPKRKTSTAACIQTFEIKH